MKYYKNAKFLIIEDDPSSNMSYPELCIVGLNLLSELEEEVPMCPCACYQANGLSYVIIPKDLGQLTEPVVDYLIRRVNSDGIDFNKDSLSSDFYLNEDTEEDVSDENEDFQPAYRQCHSVEEALQIALQLNLTDFSVIGCDDKIFIVTEQLTAMKISFYDFGVSAAVLKYLTEHGVAYYEHYDCNEFRGFIDEGVFRV